MLLRQEVKTQRGHAPARPHAMSNLPIAIRAAIAGGAGRAERALCGLRAEKGSSV